MEGVHGTTRPFKRWQRVQLGKRRLGSAVSEAPSQKRRLGILSRTSFAVKAPLQTSRAALSAAANHRSRGERMAREGLLTANGES